MADKKAENADVVGIATPADSPALKAGSPPGAAGTYEGELVPTPPEQVVTEETAPAPKAAEVDNKTVETIAAALVAAQGVRRLAPMPTPGMDVAPRKGGLYITGAGAVVDAHGNPVEDAPKEVKAQAKALKFARYDVTYAEEEV